MALSPPINIDDMMLSFFLHNHALITEPGMALTRTSMLAAELSAAQPDSSLALSARALSSGLSNLYSDLPMVYNRRAVVKIQQDLNDPVQSLANQTLLAVILLQHFEAITSFSQNKPPSITHIHGALAVVRHRGSLNYRDDFSKTLLLLVRRGLIYDSIQARQPIARDPLLFDTSPLQTEHHPAFDLDPIVADIYDLTSAAQSLATPYFTPSFSAGQASATDQTPTFLFSSALALDSRLRPLNPAVPASPISSSSSALSDPIIPTNPLLQADHDLAVLSYTQLLHHLSPSLPPATLDSAALHATTQSLVDSICQNIAAFLSAQEAEVASNTASSAESGTDVSRSRGLGTFAAVGPLRRVLAVGDFLKQGQREWVEAQLQRVGKGVWRK
ncbi:MAG: hypothetical protein M1814_003486 [Vezdaea aestivalis]|nr:MAG: hypothetical protein M1814_003486 [Vezdaea aestivalis]